MKFETPKRSVTMNVTESLGNNGMYQNVASYNQC